MPKLGARKKDPCRTKVATKERTAKELEEGHNKIQAARVKKNINQKAYKEREKIKRENEGTVKVPSPNDEKYLAIKKESNRIAQEKRMAQQGRMCLVKVDKNLMDGAFLLDPVPHYMMILLLTHCFSKEFWSKYNARKQSINLPRKKGTNFRVDAVGEEVGKSHGASYYMLNWLASSPSADPTLTDNRWENNPVMSVSGVIAIDSLGKLLSKSLKNELNSADEFTFFPGFVSTKSAAHQELHVDSTIAYKEKNKEGSYILHMPLSVEGLTLWIANLSDGTQELVSRLLGGKELTGNLPSTVEIDDFITFHLDRPC